MNIIIEKHEDTYIIHQIIKGNYASRENSISDIDSFIKGRLEIGDTIFYNLHKYLPNGDIVDILANTDNQPLDHIVDYSEGFLESHYLMTSDFEQCFPLSFDNYLRDNDILKNELENIHSKVVVELPTTKDIKNYCIKNNIVIKNNPYYAKF